MRLFFVCGLGLCLSLQGCSGRGGLSDPITDTLAQTPLMYKPDIQQGNVVTQDQVNRLEAGMSMEQVRYLLGTPMLQDSFRNNRWDYVYTMKRGGGKLERKRVTLFFADGLLSKVEGDYRPDPSNIQPPQETVVSVPDQKPKGFMDKTLSRIGLGDDELPGAKPAAVSTPGPTPAPAPASPEPAAQP
jgi:outer membrane protein assembly factor BamE